MQLIVPILLNCLLVFGVYLAEEHRLMQKYNYVTKQILIGVLFGGASALASSVGMEWLGTVMNVRDAAPLSAGLIFGAPAGIIAGIIGGLYRWFSVYWGGGVYTRLACSLATILAGFMAAGMRKCIFDNKKPNWLYGIFIAIACEVVHMILIFITNMDNVSQAFEFIKGATIPMIIGNGVAVGFALLIVFFLNNKAVRGKKERIAHTFQRWLLICIAIAFLATSVFTYNLQSEIVRVETQEVFTTAIDDVEADVKEKSKAQLLALAEAVKKEYEDNTNVSLEALSKKYDVEEINVVSKDGLIVKSTDESVVNDYNMNSDPQSKEFVDKLKTQGSFVQDYGPRGEDKTIFRKYAGINLKEGGFIQVGYNDKQFHGNMETFVIDVTKNRHVGRDGFIAVCDEALELIIDNDEYKGKPISFIGITPPSEMKNGKTSSKLYTANVVDGSNQGSEPYVYVFKFVEGYCIIAAMPETEATFMRDASLYTAVFMQILIFAALFVFIYVLIKRIIINNLRKINDTLGRITGGDLSLTVDVRTNEEFASLSDDINSTVATLKRYIAEAAARIDKELEYAKQIQQSALPARFPCNEEYSIFAQMIAAKEIGGDFYDYYQLDERTVAILVADVAGKGIPAAMFMMKAKTIIKDLAESGLPVNEILTKTNEKLCENNESGMFVTAWIGIMDIPTGRVQFANAGHNPPLIKRANGEVSYLKTRSGFVLAGMQGMNYKVNEMTLSPGDRLFLYTDGVTEATNTANELYGEERLRAFIHQNDSSQTELLLGLKADIDKFVGDAPQFDDITMLTFDYKPIKTENTAVERIFPAKTEALSDVLSFVENMLEKHQCAKQTQTAIFVVIEEVFVNIARYAYGGGEGSATISIGFEEQTRLITFRVADKGVPFNPLEKSDPDITLSAEERKIGGLGIYITKKTMDSVVYAYENGENILIMKKKI